MSEIKRRSLLQTLSMFAVGGGALVRTRDLKAAVDEATRSVKDWPAMEYRQLGNTGFNGSRLVFGCGAALSRGQANNLLEPALASGINVFDVGFRSYYRDAEQNLAPFLKKHRDEIFLISKAMVGEVSRGDDISPREAKEYANNWMKSVDESLKELGVDHMDAYYIMAANNTQLVSSDEMHQAFETVKAAGKASYFGISTHEDAEGVLLAAAATGWYSLAQIAITPAGWYDWSSKSILDDGKNMRDLRSVLDAARGAGIGLIGMKAGRHLAGRSFIGWGNPDAYDDYYSKEQMAAKLTAFQRSYAYVLANGLDAVNADMQVWQHLHENFVAATSAQKHFV